MASYADKMFPADAKYSIDQRFPSGDDRQGKGVAEDIAFRDRRQCAARPGQPAGTGQLLVEFRLFSLSEPVR
ncbi:MAG: hypothetical protein HZT41_16460 [Dechloromonas sp.]|nr:MAG: hypothetical protein HZT41_16460 [Dechloromonas sp.]